MSATLAVWTAAWLHGRAGTDDVLDALQHWSPSHEVLAGSPTAARVLDISASRQVPGELSQLLLAMRKTGVLTMSVVLPTAGDVRGLGINPEFVTAALQQQQAIIFPELSIGLVPMRVVPTMTQWLAVETMSNNFNPYEPIVASLPLRLGEAELALASSLRQAVTTLGKLDIARQRSGVRSEIARLTEQESALSWPKAMPSRAIRVLQRAADVAAIVAIADQDAPGGALSTSAALLRAQALRPLKDTVRQARMSAIAEAIRAVSQREPNH